MSEGERWTRAVLAELRGSEFRPRGWGDFLAASFERASQQRGLRPRAHRQTLALAATGSAFWGIVAISAAPILALAGVAWLALLVLMVDWHLGMLETPDGRQVTTLGSANAVTIVRGAALPAFFVVGTNGLLVAFGSVVALDIVDGALARRADRQTRLGAWLDGSLDSLTAAAVALAGVRLSAIPVWLALLVLVRVAVPWLVLPFFYFLASHPARADRELRRSGRAARLPGIVATAGLFLALAGFELGVAIATAGLTLSITQAAHLTLNARTPPPRATSEPSG